MVHLSSLRNYLINSRMISKACGLYSWLLKAFRDQVPSQKNAKEFWKEFLSYIQTHDGVVELKGLEGRSENVTSLNQGTMIPTKISPSSPSSSSSSYSTSSSSLVMHPRRRRRFDHTTNGASLVIAYLLFAACMSLIVVLPLSFFVVNYGTCSYFCGWFCRHKASLVDVNTRERRVTKDHVSLDNELNPMDIEMINVKMSLP